MPRSMSGHLLILVCGILFAHEQLAQEQEACRLSRRLVELTCGTAPVTAPVAAPVTAPVAAPISAPVTAPVTAPVSAPVSAPVTAPTNCEGPYPGFAECEDRIQWMVANWNTVDWSQVYIDGGVDGSRCSVQRYLNLFDEGGVHGTMFRSQ